MIEVELEAKTRQLDPTFSVGRVLPSQFKRAVGPFVFFDHMGPAHLEATHGMDVRPHPHINLATVTYLFEGAILHQDSTGASQVIRPGDINWMHAGRGIVHSERSPTDERAKGPHLHGLQLWVALPEAQEESAPAFFHHPAATMPEQHDAKMRLRVLAGQAYGVEAPVRVASPLFYVEVHLQAGGSMPLPSAYAERAAYVVAGELEVDGHRTGNRRMLVFSKGDATLRATVDAHFVLLGGEPLGPRFMWWNFVSSSKERIVQAAEDWRAARFAVVPGDAQEHIPAPDGPRFV
jgi:redox-sensitive bicupin YhaK (pirin superfamily)